MSFLAAVATALGLGIWTALQPCPMASNLAAVSYLGRRVDRPIKVLLAGLLYALGQAVTYVVLAIVILGGLVSSWRLSTFLQENITLVLGPIWILTAMLLLEMIHLPLPNVLSGAAIGPKWPARIEAWGLWSAFPLGIMLALAFCPASATCFFVSLMTILATSHSRILLPAVFGVGAALPAVLLAVLIAYGASAIGRVWDRSEQIQRGLRRFAGVALLLMGIHYAIRFNFDVTPFWDSWIGAVQSAWSRLLGWIGGG